MEKNGNGTSTESWPKDPNFPNCEFYKELEVQSQTGVLTRTVMSIRKPYLKNHLELKGDWVVEINSTSPLQEGQMEKILEEYLPQTLEQPKEYLNSNPGEVNPRYRAYSVRNLQ